MLKIALGCLLGGLWLSSASAADTAPAMPAAPSFVNIAINVSDIDRAAKFYVDALGFEDKGGFVPDPTTPTVYGLPGKIDMKAHNIRMGSFAILLREFKDPKTLGKTGKFPMNQLGLGNLTINVADIDKAAVAVRKFGGTVDEKTKALRAGVGPWMMMAADPDGTRIELIQFVAH